jgi:hypothetical protein
MRLDVERGHTALRSLNWLSLCGKRGPIGDTDLSDEFLSNFIKHGPPSNSQYEGREDFFGRVVVSTHSDVTDPKCFLTFSSEQSSADCALHSPASGYQENPAKNAKPRSTRRPTSRRRRHRGSVAQAEEPMDLNGVPEPSMTSGAITQEIIDETDTSVRKSLPHRSHDAGPVKRKLSHDGMRSELRRSGRLAKRART